MTTLIRPEISKNSRYYINRHRYYELKHFCLQYPVWKRAHESLDGLSKRPDDLLGIQKSGIPDPTARAAESRAEFARRMELVESAAKETDEIIGDYILEGVTEALSYDKLNARTPVPCCKDDYYRLCRKFFWILDKKRG